MVAEATGLSVEQSERLLDAARGSVKVAIVMALRRSSRVDAKARLVRAHGHVRAAVGRRGRSRRARSR
ncbi:MAG: hypothetical protein ACREKB_02690, partial [Candidatus Rokuibacteriota bacterium]